MAEKSKAGREGGKEGGMCVRVDRGGGSFIKGAEQ